MDEETQIGKVSISTDEIREIERITQKDKKNFKKYISVYNITKLGFKGKRAIEKINDVLEDSNKINKQEFDKIMRAFREKSKLLKAEKSEAVEKSNPEILKIKDKMDILMEKGITEEKIIEAKLRDAVWAYNALFDKMRLLENKSTENIAIAGQLKDKTNEKIISQMKVLKKDMEQMAQFAKNNNIKLPSDEYIEMKLKESGDIQTAEVVSPEKETDE